MKKALIIFLLLGLVTVSGCSLTEKLGFGKPTKEVKPGSMNIGEVNVEETDTGDGRVSVTSIGAILKTSMGDITVSFYHAETAKTIMNFANLAGANFYDGTKFHRVIKDFMVQAGDPNSRDDDRSDDGTGGPGYVFEDEINPRVLEGLDENDIKKLEEEGYVYNYEIPGSHNVTRGVIAMANSGPNTNGSQFFILTGEAAPWLDGRHTVFGEVVRGMEVVDAINSVETGEGDYPVSDIILKDVIILVNKGFEDYLETGELPVANEAEERGGGNVEETSPLEGDHPQGENKETEKSALEGGETSEEAGN